MTFLPLFPLALCGVDPLHACGTFRAVFGPVGTGGKQRPTVSYTHLAAARYLKELKDSGEGITPKAWQREIDQLTAGKQTDTLAMKSMREDLKAVERLRKTCLLYTSRRRRTGGVQKAVTSPTRDKLSRTF